MPAEDMDEARAALEARMGEIAALLDDVAEALVHYPEEITITDSGGSPLSGKRVGGVMVRTDAWPSIQEIEQLLANWRAQQMSSPRTGGRPRAA